MDRLHRQVVLHHTPLLGQGDPAAVGMHQSVAQRAGQMGDHVACPRRVFVDQRAQVVERIEHEVGIEPRTQRLVLQRRPLRFGAQLRHLAVPRTLQRAAAGPQRAPHAQHDGGIEPVTEDRGRAIVRTLSRQLYPVPGQRGQQRGGGEQLGSRRHDHHREQQPPRQSKQIALQPVMPQRPAADERAARPQGKRHHHRDQDDAGPVPSVGEPEQQAHAKVDQPERAVAPPETGIACCPLLAHRLHAATGQGATGRSRKPRICVCSQRGSSHIRKW